MDEACHSDHYAIDLVGDCGGAERVRGVFDRVQIMYERAHSQETASVHDDSFPLVGRASKSTADFELIRHVGFGHVRL